MLLYYNWKEIDWLFELQNKSMKEAWECFANILDEQLNSTICPQEAEKRS